MSLFKSVRFGWKIKEFNEKKAALNPLVSRWSVSSEFSFCAVGKTRFSHAIAANKRANSHNFETKYLNLLTITFLADYLMNRGKSSYMN